jgi:hypothetical protein
MERSLVCSVCNDGCHLVTKCPALHDVLNEGFYKGGDGGGGHGDDEDDCVRADASGSVEDVLEPVLSHALLQEDTTGGAGF